MKTELLYIIYTHNRKQILSESWRTLFENNKLRPTRVLVIDDGSTPEVKQGIFNAHFSADIPIDFYSLSKNVGYGECARKAFSLLETYNPEYVFFIESDYIFRKNGLDTVWDLFHNNEYGQNCVAFSGYDNPDFYKKEFIEVTAPRIIKEDFGEDNLNRSIMYKPFKQQTKYGEIDLELVSNSCGTMYFNWNKIREFRIYHNDIIENWIKNIIDNPKSPGLLNDGNMSHGISWIWSEYNYKLADKYAALLNIKPSVANHINGSGINGGFLREGESFVSSPTWKE